MNGNKWPNPASANDFSNPTGKERPMSAIDQARFAATNGRASAQFLNLQDAAP
ncbi:MAG TPA: hypothetical protein VIW70_02900 [Rubrivivax sp.]